MQLPLKFLPRVSQQLAEVIGGLVMTGMGATFLVNYLPGSSPHPGESFGAWLGADGRAWPFVVLSTLLILAGLCWLTVAVVNLAGGSPFEYLIVDRFGITYRNFWREQRYSWKDLGPISAYRVPMWQSRRGQRRYWITADTLGEAEGGGGGVLTALFFGRPAASLRIPAATYCASGFLATSLSLAAQDAAGWFEGLRQLARNDMLDKELVPDPPECFRPPTAIDYAAPDGMRQQPDAGP